MMHETDPRKLILDNLGDSLDAVTICNNEVLIATYRRPEKTSGGIILARQTLEEDLYQSKCGLIVKIGSMCDFPLVEVKLHDWVVIRPSDAWACEILPKKGAPVHCRLVVDKYIRAVVAYPDMVW